jgi:hypothetical protein
MPGVGGALGELPRQPAQLNSVMQGCLVLPSILPACLPACAQAPKRAKVPPLWRKCLAAESGETQAERLLHLYETEWGRSVDPYFSPEFSY